MLSTVGASKSRTLYLLLREQIAGGALSAGDRLPSEPALALEHGVSRVTVRRALDALEEDGLIRRQAGAGTFVAESGRSEPIVADFANMLAHLVEMGRATRVKLLSFAYVAPPPHVADALGLGAEERAQHSVRVRYMDGQPFSHLVTYVPERIGAHWSEAEMSSRPLLSLLERSGVKAERARQSVSAVLAGPDVADALDIGVGSALLEIRRTVFDRNDRGIEYLHALYRPDRYLFRMDMNRNARGGEWLWRPVEREAEPQPRVRARTRANPRSKPVKRIRGGSS